MKALVILGHVKNNKPTTVMLNRLDKAMKLYEKNNYKIIFLVGGKVEKSNHTEAYIMNEIIKNIFIKIHRHLKLNQRTEENFKKSLKY